MLASSFSLGLLVCSPDPEDTGPVDTGAEIDGLSLFTYDPTSSDSAPVEGVTVAFDTTDGERLEVITGADSLDGDPQLEPKATGTALELLSPLSP